MVTSTTLGMPRIGPRRELKRAMEDYWSGRAQATEVHATARQLRAASWQQQRDAGIDQIPSNDFSLYDQILDATCLVGAVPARFGLDGDRVDLDTYIAMARGRDGNADQHPAHPLEMTKWFDTNYHYLVPELGPDTVFRRMSDKPLDEFAEARDLGITTRPVLIGPVTYLLLAKPTLADFSPLALLDQLLPIYEELLRELQEAGADWVQFDEPSLATDLDDQARAAYEQAYERLAASSGCRLLVTSYFGGLDDNTALATSLPVAGLHIDLVRAPDQLDAVVEALGPDTVLSLGLVDGRNIWRTDLTAALDRVEPLVDRLGPDRLWVAPSCSLLHVPYDLQAETDLDPRVRPWLAFAAQKLGEVTTLARALNDGRKTVADALAASDAAAQDRRDTVKLGTSKAAARASAVTADDARRRSPYRDRHAVQREAIPLPPLPTTTIGSFPQTDEIRRTRRQHAEGAIDDETHRRFMQEQIEQVIREQEALGLDVLVHGEPERNDMVQYFGEQLTGFVSMQEGWVQSYGTRCVRPPILWGDVERPAPMTVEWALFAQSLTDRPVKGMLTGPVTILEWSFVRNDQPEADTCRQIALAIRDEVVDLEQAGIRIIQVDEPALREGLPLRRRDWEDYLGWATECFRLATSGVEDATQIHTHMCYAEFGDILTAVPALDADVISLEAARSDLHVIDELGEVDYAAGVGPGVYDIHSPQVPSEDEISAILEKARGKLDPEQLWVNPDCGLKTRRWPEVTAALQSMVAAARSQRAGAA